MAKNTEKTYKNISFKIDEKIHKRAKKYCEKNNITLKDYIINFLDESTKTTRKKPNTDKAAKLDLKDK